MLQLALGHDAALPQVLGPAEQAGTSAVHGLSTGAVLGPGTGDNMAAALGVGARTGDVIVSIGTSGVVSAVAAVPAADPSGIVAGFADATGHFLPLVCTLNAARVLDATARMLGVDHAAMSDLALSAPPGAGGLVLVPYLEGERTPNRPEATGALHGLRLQTTTPAHLARAAIEGLLCGLADGLDALIAQGATVRAGAAGRRRCPVGGAVPDRPDGARPPGDRAAARGVRRGRRGAPGRLGARRRGRGGTPRHCRRATAVGVRRHADLRRRGDTPTSASGTPRSAT